MSEINVKKEIYEISDLVLEVGNLVEAARYLGLPFSLWRKPNEQQMYFLLSFDKNLQKGAAKIEEMPPGFIVSAFTNEAIEQAGLMVGDLVFTLSTDGKVLSYQELVTTDKKSAVTSFFDYTQELIKNQALCKYNNHLFLLSEENDRTKHHYLSIVQEAVEAINEGRFDKVVLSRTKQFKIEDSFDVVGAFLKLEKAYKSAFVSLINLPETEEMWMGASPEILVEVIGQKIFKTIALAGTQTALDQEGNIIGSDDAKWGQKEIEEQALVSRYIVSCFKKIRLREYTEKGPKSALAGNLYHLKSDFEVDMVDCCFPDLGTVMLSLLHPTSAICGTPKLPAMEFILEKENYERSYYSGFIGPVNVEDVSSIYVNLRVMKIQENTATFYAGAGITAGSDAHKEWIETELKCDTLLRVINTSTHA